MAADASAQLYTFLPSDDVSSSDRFVQSMGPCGDGHSNEGGAGGKRATLCQCVSPSPVCACVRMMPLVQCCGALCFYRVSSLCCHALSCRAFRVCVRGLCGMLSYCTAVDAVLSSPMRWDQFGTSRSGSR